MRTRWLTRTAVWQCVFSEDGLDALSGSVFRFDDEGITFKSASKGLTFDVRDLVAGTQRGDQFDVVSLGTSKDDRWMRAAVMRRIT